LGKRRQRGANCRGRVELIMARHVWTVLCTKASIDRETNNVSLFDVLDKISVFGPQHAGEAAVAVPIQFEVAILWARSVITEAETVLARLSFVAPNGQRFEGGTVTVELIGDFHRSRTFFQINGLPVIGPGVYDFVVEYQPAGVSTWAEVSRTPLEVEFASAPTPMGLIETAAPPA
jgi:hypothetical protein